MRKPSALRRGDKVAIVSLSSGVLGEPFAKHQVELAKKRLEMLGLVPVFMPNALKGLKVLEENPQARAQDLKDAFADDSIKGIFCAIGGIDTYRLSPYLLEDAEFLENVLRKPKLFTGFSDTTNNHFLFYKLGMVSYYGPNILNDIAELDTEMIPYTRQTIQYYFDNPETITIESSPIWYEERTDFSSNSIGVPRISHEETRGYEVLQGSGVVEGRLLGGCIESIFDMITGDRFPDQKDVVKKYDLFPTLKEWKGKILFLETSEECPDKEQMLKYLKVLKEEGILDAVSAILVGKPQNEIHYEEIKEAYLESTDTPILFNINFGHAYPRTVIPYGLKAKIDFDTKTLTIEEPLFESKLT